MKNYLLLLTTAFLFSCNEKQEENALFVKGEIKNAGTQKAYLEEVYFIQKAPLIVDTAEVKDGKFEMQTKATVPGLYRIRFEDGKQFFFVNDQPSIKIVADANDPVLSNIKVDSRANQTLYAFVGSLEKTNAKINSMNEQLRQMLALNSKDSAATQLQQEVITYMNNGNAYLDKFVDTVSHPVVAMFALGYLVNGDPAKATEEIVALKKRFPAHKALDELESELKASVAKGSQVSNKPAVGSLAPDITMNDVDGKPASLSSMKGKYVLVDFWASWCGPCRQENPNIVNAYNKFKSKNFTILGVSLDKEKDPWVQAIADDGLTWKHISDLKFWQSEAVALYGIESIPANVLLDPTGKIIATDLHGTQLEETLATVLK